MLAACDDGLGAEEGDLLLVGEDLVQGEGLVLAEYI